MFQKIQSKGERETSKKKSAKNESFKHSQNAQFDCFNYSKKKPFRNDYAEGSQEEKKKPND